MKENNKKKLIVSSVIAVAFLIMLTVGATYAYFSASSDSNAITNIAGRTPKLSNIVLSQLIDNLHIRLQPSDLNKNSEVRTYYATSDETKNYEITEEAGTNIIASVSVLQDAINTYECSANITVSLISEKENSLSEVINKNDLKLKLTGNSLEEEYDLSNIKNELEANKKVYVTNFDVSKINKNEIKLQVLLNNDPNKAQDYLVNKELNISVEVSDLKCILKDTTAPTIEEFTVTGVTDNTELTDNKLYTHKNQVSYKLTFTDEDVESYCITENDSCNDGEWKSVGDSKTITNTLTLSNNNEGLKTINAFLKDKKGNVSITKTKTITLDTSNPTAEVKENTKDTSSITVTVSGTDTTPSSSIIERQCRVKETEEWTNAPDGSCTINNLNDGTEYTIEARVRDVSGRWSQEPYPSVSVLTDKDITYTCDGIGGTLTYNPSYGQSSGGYICVWDAVEEQYGCAGCKTVCSWNVKYYSTKEQCETAKANANPPECFQGCYEDPGSGTWNSSEGAHLECSEMCTRYRCPNGIGSLYGSDKCYMPARVS